METKKRLALKHLNGLYLSWSPDKFPLTPKVSQARRFYTTEDITYFLTDSHYRPDNPEEYEIVTLLISYEEVTEDVPQVGDDS